MCRVLCLGTVVRGGGDRSRKQIKGLSPHPGIEPGSPSYRPSMLTTTPMATHYLLATCASLQSECTTLSYPYSTSMWVLSSVTFKFFCWGEPEMNSKAENGEGSVCSVPLLKLKVCLVESSYIWDINGPKNAMWKKSTSFFYSILQIIERLIVAASLYLKKVPKILQRFY